MEERDLEAEVTRLRRKKRLVNFREEAAGDLEVPLKMTLFPSVYERLGVEQLFEDQRVINKLVYKVSEDRAVLDLVAKGGLVVAGERIEARPHNDPMYRTLERIRKEKRGGKREAMFVRADYIESRAGEFKQVEINTMACSFPVFGAEVNGIHARMFQSPEYRKAFQRLRGQSCDGKVLISDSDRKFVSFVKECRDAYARESLPRYPLCALLVDNDISIFCKNYVEKAKIIDSLGEAGIEMAHVTSKDIRKSLEISEGGRRVIYKNKEVFLAYYRWLYNADQYTEGDVELRVLLERSSCMNVPSVEVQIVGLKFFQGIFARRPFLERYLADGEINRVMRYFVDFMTVEEYGRRGPGNKAYVLKPLKEGGGNNLFGEDVARKLSELGDEERGSYVLMEEIYGKTRRNKFLGEPEGNLIGEIGVFGYVIGSQGGMERNEDAGYILRSKDEASKEGGVSMNYGGLDSIIV